MFSRALRLTVLTLSFALALMMLSGGAVSVWFGLNGSFIADYFFLFRIGLPSEMLLVGLFYLIFGCSIIGVLVFVLKKDVLKLAQRTSSRNDKQNSNDCKVSRDCSISV